MAQITTNQPLVDSRARLGRMLTTASLIVILGPLFFTIPTLFSGKNDMPTDQLLLLYGALFLGLILSNVGGYFLNRWGFKQYERVGTALKGLDKRFKLYNYLLPVSNALLTPFGVTVLLIKNIDGQVAVNQKGWRQTTGLVRLLRRFSAEQLGDPTRDLETDEKKMREFIAERGGADFQPPIEGLIVFTNPKVSLEMSNVQLPVVNLNENEDALKNALRRDKKAPQLSKADYDKLYAIFESEANAQREKAERGFTLLGRKVF